MTQKLNNSVKQIFSAVFISLIVTSAAEAATTVSIKGSSFYINGAITYPGKPQQGMLPNSRMVQATFDDSNSATISKWVYPDTGKWDPARNTKEFINAIPSWRKYGLLAVTLNLQGGGPINGSFTTPQPWINTAFNNDGSLKPAYMARLDSVIQALDANGMVAILGLFYFGQAGRLSSDQAVINAVNNATDWVLSKKYTNVIIEIANESSDGHYSSRPILKPANIAQLVTQVRTRSGGKIPVSTSFNGGVIPPTAVMTASDYILLHGNGQSAAGITSMVNTTRKLTAKPIVFNEDSTATANYTAAIKAGASWGYYDQGKNNYVDGFQSVPVNWNVNTTAKKAFFQMIGGTTPPSTLSCNIHYSAVTGTYLWDTIVDAFRVGLTLKGFTPDSSGNITVTGSVTMRNAFKINFWSDKTSTSSINGSTGTFNVKMQTSGSDGSINLYGFLADGTPDKLRTGDNPVKSITVNGIQCQ